MRRLRRDLPQDLSCVYVPVKCTIERFVSSPNFTTFTDKQSEDIMLYLRYNTTLLNTHELISDPVPFKWLCREMCRIGRKLFQYFVDTIFAFFLLGIA